MPFATFVQGALFDPLQLSGIAFVGDAAPASEPHLTGLGDVLPLSNGDGGLWTTAAAFADWLDHQNRDTLGLAELLEQPGRLPDGSATDYGWGIGIRSFGGHPLFIHGGSWPGAQAKAVRCPGLGLSIVALTTSNADPGVGWLVDGVLRAAGAGR